MPINKIGNDAAETFSVGGTELAGGVIDGAGGTDVLELRDFFYPQLFDFTTLATFKNVEVIKGVIEEAHIRIRADQLAGVTTIDSDGTAYLDKLVIVGANVDLSTKTLVGRLEIIPETANAVIKVADYAMASLIKPTVRGVHVQITSGALTQEQRVALYDQGIDKITDAGGVTTEASGPVMTALQGDAVAYKGEVVFLDTGSNVALRSEAHLKSLVVKFVGAGSLYNLLDVELGSRLKIQGTDAEGNNRVFVDDVEIGSAFRASFEGSLHFSFNDKATADRVQEVIRSISYEYNFFSAPKSGSLAVEFILQDVGGRVAKATSTINFGEETPQTDIGKTVTGTDLGETLSGSAGDDVLEGLLGDDVLKGLEGHDTLYGGAGKDTLTGGAGKDAFVFTTKPGKANVDKITDFSVKDDSISLENAIFTKLGKKNGQLKKSYFFKGAKAHDKDDYIVYDPKKGALYYDKDGSGASKAVQIASLKTKLAMTYKDFFVV